MVNDANSRALKVGEIADHFNFYDPLPVISLIGANSSSKSKLMGGLVRAARNTGAVILSSGISSGVEKHCLRRNVNLIGIAPEEAINYPKPNPEVEIDKVLTNGHTHFILLKEKKRWGDELKFKMNFAERLISGRKGYSYRGKGVGVIFGNITGCEDEILLVDF